MKIENRNKKKNKNYNLISFHIDNSNTVQAQNLKNKKIVNRNKKKNKNNYLI